MFRTLFILGRDFSKEINKNHISAYASSCAFFIFLSLFPILLLICAILPYTNLTADNLVFYLKEILPGVIEPMAQSMVYEVYDRSIAIISISALGALWSAGKGILALLRGLNVIHKVEETRNYVLLRIRASIYTLIMLVAVLFSLMIIGLGQYLVGIIVSYVPQIQLFLEFLLSIRHVFTVVILEVVFVMIFTWLPNGKVKWRNQIPGALVVGIGWTVFSTVFSVYVGKFAAFSMYGSMATVIVLMLWLYICMYIVLLGALINKYLEPATNFMIAKLQQKKEAIPGKEA